MRYPTYWVGTVVLCGLFLSCGRPQAPGKPALERSGIITMAPHLTETVFALGQGGRVIAVGAFCDYPPEIAALPKVGGYIDADLERITMLSPELLLLAGKHQKVTEYAQLHDLPVVHIHMDSLETIDAGIAQIGEALGCVEAADAMRARIKAELAAVCDAVAGRPRPKVLVITGRTQHNLNSLFTAGGASFVSEIVEVAGGDNIYGHARDAYIEASKETVVLKAPEVILEFHSGEALSGHEQALYVKDWERLTSLPAVKNGRVHLILESHALRPGPRVGEVARMIAKTLHPEASFQ